MHRATQAVNAGERLIIPGNSHSVGGLLLKVLVWNVRGPNTLCWNLMVLTMHTCITNMDREKRSRSPISSAMRGPRPGN